MNLKIQSIAITIVTIAVASLLIAGTILAPTQASAISQHSVSVNREHRDQHIGQENLCFRSNTCSQSNTGQNTLGNDNQVTGFTDQSDNPQQTLTPTVIPTPTPTPTPIPGACPAGTIFDVTLQVAIGTNPVLPIGTVLCISGTGMGNLAILPDGTTATVSVAVAVPPSGQCPTGFTAAALTSGVLPAPISGTTVCVSLG